jgi:hypothetical protein
MFLRCDRFVDGFGVMGTGDEAVELDRSGLRFANEVQDGDEPSSLYHLLQASILSRVVQPRAHHKWYDPDRYRQVAKRTDC